MCIINILNIYVKYYYLLYNVDITMIKYKDKCNTTLKITSNVINIHYKFQ